MMNSRGSGTDISPENVHVDQNALWVVRQVGRTIGAPLADKKPDTQNPVFSQELDALRQLIQRYPEAHLEKPLSKEALRELWYQEWIERRAPNGQCSGQPIPDTNNAHNLRRSR